MMCVCAFREGRGVVVCINEKIGIKVHGGEREKKFYKNTGILLCWVSGECVLHVTQSRK